MNASRDTLLAPYTYTSPSGALGTVGCVLVFATMPLVGILHELYVKAPLPVFFAAVGVVVVLILMLYVYVSMELTIEVDTRGLRITKQRVVGPFRGALETVHCVPFDAVTQARELRAHAPSKNGGWNVRHELQFAEHGRIESTSIPGDPMDGPFREMAKRVQAHLGDRFTLVEDFGPMTAAVNRQVSEAMAKKEPPREEP